jgi:hypothetical protein
VHLRNGPHHLITVRNLESIVLSDGQTREVHVVGNSCGHVRDMEIARHCKEKSLLSVASGLRGTRKRAHTELAILEVSLHGDEVRRGPQKMDHVVAPQRVNKIATVCCGNTEEAQAREQGRLPHGGGAGGRGRGSGGSEGREQVAAIDACALKANVQLYQRLLSVAQL